MAAGGAFDSRSARIRIVGITRNSRHLSNVNGWWATSVAGLRPPTKKRREKKQIFSAPLLMTLPSPNDDDAGLRCAPLPLTTTLFRRWQRRSCQQPTIGERLKLQSKMDTAMRICLGRRANQLCRKRAILDWFGGRSHLRSAEHGAPVEKDLRRGSHQSP